MKSRTELRQQMWDRLEGVGVARFPGVQSRILIHRHRRGRAATGHSARLAGGGGEHHQGDGPPDRRADRG